MDPNRPRGPKRGRNSSSPVPDDEKIEWEFEKSGLEKEVRIRDVAIDYYEEQMVTSTTPGEFSRGEEEEGTAQDENPRAPEETERKLFSAKNDQDQEGNSSFQSEQGEIIVLVPSGPSSFSPVQVVGSAELPVTVKVERQEVEEKSSLENELYGTNSMDKLPEHADQSDLESDVEVLAQIGPEDREFPTINLAAITNAASSESEDEIDGDIGTDGAGAVVQGAARREAELNAENRGDFSLPDESGNKILICPTCRRQDDGTPMVGCDICDQWFHFPCAGITEEPSEEGEWYCHRCKI